MKKRDVIFLAPSSLDVRASPISQHLTCLPQHRPSSSPLVNQKKGMVAGNGAAGFYLTKEQRPIKPAEAAAVSGSESGKCVPASLCCPLSISNPRVGGAWPGHLLFWPHPT